MYTIFNSQCDLNLQQNIKHQLNLFIQMMHKVWFYFSKFSEWSSNSFRPLLVLCIFSTGPWLYFLKTLCVHYLSTYMQYIKILHTMNKIDFLSYFIKNNHNREQLLKWPSEYEYYYLQITEIVWYFLEFSVSE